MSLEKNHEIKWVDTKTLKEHPDNNNKHPKEQIERLVKVIKYQGFRSPITVSNRSGYIVAGHARLKAAKKMGLKKVPVMFQDFEDEAQEYAHLTADNALALWSKIDMDSVEDFAKSLDPDFDVDFLGFSDFELKDDLDCGDSEKDDEVPETDENEFGVKLGDIWRLGEHRVMCGDSTCEETVSKLMNGEKADMVFTDPPYNQSSNGGGFVEDRPGFNKLINSGLNDFDPEMTFKILDLIDADTMYIFTSKDLIRQYIGHFEKRNWTLLTMVKRNPIPLKNNRFLTDVEYLFCIRKKGSYWKNDCPYDYYRRHQEINVKPSEFGHPTEKQVAYCQKYFEISSKKQDLVLDLFLGSGTTLITSEKTNRKCYGMELDPHYVSVIIKRWQDYTGKKAVKIDG